MAQEIKYRSEMIDKAYEYINNYDSDEHGDTIPQFASLALVLGIHRDTLYDWAKNPEKYPGMSDVMKDLKAKQERVLLNQGLKGGFKGDITKLILSKHGYSDKIQQEITSPDGSMSPKDSTAAVVEALKRKYE